MERAKRLRRLGWGVGMGLLYAATGAGASAQSDSQGQSMGSVAGRVISSDTQRPVRFAQVMLQRVTDGDHGGGSGLTHTRTDVEGNFMAVDVAPGDYYVTANAPGYVSERALLQAGVAAGRDPVALLAQIPVVKVTSGQSMITVPIERGGTISGKVQWDDGSPAAGLTLSAILPTGATSSAPLPGVLQGVQSAGGATINAVTDDQGTFRLTGLASGTYLVRSIIQAALPLAGFGRQMTFVPTVRMYAPGVFRKAEAKPIEVKVGEERNDLTMVIDLRGLHTVTGNVSSASGGLSVASGRVTLADSSDNDLQPGGSVASDGSFSVRYVPAGSYTLRVAGASTQATANRGRGTGDSTAVSFQPFSGPLTVSDRDVSGVGITLTPVTSQP